MIDVKANNWILDPDFFAPPNYPASLRIQTMIKTEPALTFQEVNAQFWYRHFEDVEFLEAGEMLQKLGIRKIKRSRAGRVYQLIQYFSDLVR